MSNFAKTEQAKTTKTYQFFSKAGNNNLVRKISKRANEVSELETADLLELMVHQRMASV